MMLSLALTSAAMTSGGLEAMQWKSLNHDFACDLRTVQGQTIPLSGFAIETVTEKDGRQQSNGEFAFRSADKSWSFLSGRAPTSGGVPLGGSHTVFIDNIDDPTVDGFKPYSVQMTFANRIDGLSGPYAYAVLRDQTAGGNRPSQGSDYPIVAAGVCLMTPKAGASK